MSAEKYNKETYTEHIERRRSSAPKRNANEVEDGAPADGVLSSLLELYGGRTLKMTGPSQSGVTNYSQQSYADGERPPIRQRRRSFLGRRVSVTSIKSGQTRKEQKARRSELVAKLASVLERQKFLLKLAKALLVFGSPSHRIEDQLESTARALQLDAQFLHLPLMIICSFGDAGTRTSETFFVKAAGGINLGCLKEIHVLHNQVTHGEVSAVEGTERLDKMIKAKPLRSDTQLILMSGLMGFIIAPLGFDGSLVDAAVAGVFNLVVQLIQVYIAGRNAAFQPIFEISVSVLVSIASRALAYTNYWCYNAIVSSGLIAVLPGMMILSGALELGSRKIISGSVKMVYAVVFSLFLGFGISVGSDVYFLFNPSGRIKESGGLNVNVWETSGTFDFGGDYTGTWTFSNATQLHGQQTAFHALQKGQISCYRKPSWPWWQQTPSEWFFFLWVPIFAFLQCISKHQPIFTKDTFVMWFIAVTGFVFNELANRYIFSGSDVTSFMGAFLVSALGAINARLFGGTAFTATVPGILFLVPGGLAAAGGLAMTTNGDNSYADGFEIGLRMVQTAIGIVVGVFTGAFMVYGLVRRKGKNGAVFAF